MKLRHGYSSSKGVAGLSSIPARFRISFPMLFGKLLDLLGIDVDILPTFALQLSCGLSDERLPHFYCGGFVKVWALVEVLVPGIRYEESVLTKQRDMNTRLEGLVERTHTIGGQEE
jgi:hypothetical protein